MSKETGSRLPREANTQPGAQGNARRKLAESAKPYGLSAAAGLSAMKPSRMFISLVASERSDWRRTVVRVPFDRPGPRHSAGEGARDDFGDHAAVYNTFNVQRHLISAQTHRALRGVAKPHGGLQSQRPDNS